MIYIVISREKATNMKKKKKKIEAKKLIYTKNRQIYSEKN